MDKIDLTVIIPTRNRANLLPMGLAHLEVQSHPAARFEIIVVDEGSTDDTPDIVERYASGAPVRTRCIRQNKGSALAARNQAIREAMGRWILFLDEDLLAGNGLVSSHVRAHQESAARRVVLGRVMLHPQIDPAARVGLFYPSPDKMPEPAHPISFLHWRMHNLSVPRQVLLDLGGFDESFPASTIEDVELAWRLLHTGASVMYVSEACAYAWRPVSFDSERRRHYLEGRGIHQLLEKVPDAAVIKFYKLHWNWFAAMIAPLSVSIYSHIGRIAPYPGQFFEWLGRSILHYDLVCGYRDAANGLPSRVQE